MNMNFFFVRTLLIFLLSVGGGICFLSYKLQGQPLEQQRLPSTYLNVMTFNIRYNTLRDSANAWSFRKDLVSNQILFHEVHILGVQEALYDQIQDLQKRLPAYRRVGVGRDDGATKGEFSAIFFDSTRLKMVTSGTFWLSPTPSVAGSKGWDAALPRIATWVTLRDKQSKSTVTIINTHLDHQGVQARKESAHLILQKLAAMRPRENSIVMGDLNSIPSDGDRKSVV